MRIQTGKQTGKRLRVPGGIVFPGNERPFEKDPPSRLPAILTTCGDQILKRPASGNGNEFLAG